MHRLLVLLSLALALPVTALACDMSTNARSDSVADYVEDARSCLAAPPQGFAFDEQMELAFIRLINEERVSRGLQPLILRDDMRPAARFHSLDMGINNFFGHETPKGRKSAFRISAFDRTLLTQLSAENVAQLETKWTCTNGAGETISCAGMVDELNNPFAGAVERLHTDLMNSPGHRDNILSPKSTHISLGVATSDTGIYVTQLFAKPIGRFLSPLPLRLVAGQGIDADVELDGYDFKRFALMEGSKVKDLFDADLPDEARGDLELAVRGENTETIKDGGRVSQVFNVIYLPGPSVTVVESDPATGS